MDIKFFGHAAVGLQSKSGESLILDPYRVSGFGGKIRYTSIEGSWDWIIITHDHDDHNAKDTLKGPLKGSPSALDARFNLRRLSVAHDEYEGRRFDGDVDITCFDFDGLRFCHLSDVGCSPTRAIIDAIGPIDICFIPVGGFFTIGPLQAKAWWKALHPEITIPIHYKTPSIDLDLEKVENFLENFQPEMIQKSPSLSITHRSDLAKYADILVLEPINQK